MPSASIMLLPLIPYGPPQKFLYGGGASPRKALIWRKSSKKAPNVAQNILGGFSKGGDGLLLPPPAGAHDRYSIARNTSCHIKHD